MLDIFCFPTTFLLLLLMWVICFCFQLIKINFLLVENVKFFVITLHNSKVLWNQVQLVRFSGKIHRKLPICWHLPKNSLSHWWRRFLSNRNQSIALLCKLVDWFPYDRNLGHKRINGKLHILCSDSKSPVKMKE